MSAGPGYPEALDGTVSPGPVAVCVLRMERRGGAVAITVSATSDVQRGDGEQFVTPSLEEALDVVRALAAVVRDAPG